MVNFSTNGVRDRDGRVDRAMQSGIEDFRSSLQTEEERDQNEQEWVTGKLRAQAAALAQHFENRAESHSDMDSSVYDPINLPVYANSVAAHGLAFCKDSMYVLKILFFESCKASFPKP